MISLPAEEAMVSGAGSDWGRDTTSSGEPGWKIGKAGGGKQVCRELIGVWVVIAWPS